MASNTKCTNPTSLHHRIMAGFIGNVVEWYDFAPYGCLAGILAPVFSHLMFQLLALSRPTAFSPPAF